MSTYSIFGVRVRTLVGLTILFCALGGTQRASAVDITFEAPTYTTGSIIGQDGWVQNGYVTGAFFGGPNGTAEVSAATPLVGSASLLFNQTAVTGTGAGVPGASDLSKPEVIAVSSVAGTDLSVSYLISAMGNAQDPDGQAGVYLSHNASGGLSPIFARLNGAIMEVGNAGSPGGIAVVPDFTYFAGDILEVTYDVDFDVATYDVSVTNLSFGGFEFTQTFNFLGAFVAEGANGEYLVDVGTLLRSGTAKIDDISLTAGTGPVVTEFAWSGNASGNWNQSINWAPQGVPGSRPGLQTAIFGDAITSNQTVFNNSSRSVNRIEFDNANSYFIAGTGSIDLQADTSGDTPVNPTVEVASGNHQFQIPVNLLDDTTVNVAAGASLAFNNQINLGGNTLTTAGDVSINHSTIGGGAVVGSGSLGTLGSVDIGGDLVSTGAMIFDLGSGGIDMFNVTGNATLSGVVDVVLEPGFAPDGPLTIVAAGGTLDVTALSLHASDVGNFALSTSGNNLMLTYIAGAVPEPTTSGLALLGFVVAACLRPSRAVSRAALWAVALFASQAVVEPASAASFDFENPPYSAGPLLGQEGWVTNAYVGPANLNGDVVISSTSPLAGSQSLLYTQTSTPVGFGAADMSKPSVAFAVADGTTAVDLTATVQLQADANTFAAGQVGIFLSHSAFDGQSPIGVKLNGADSSSGAGIIEVLHTSGFVNPAPYTPNNVLEFQFGVDFDEGGSYELAVRDLTLGEVEFTPLAGPLDGGRFGFFNAPFVFPADGDGVTFTVDVGTLFRGGVGRIDNFSVVGDEFTQALWQGGSGDWTQNGNWIPQMIPNAPTGNAQIAIFGNRNTAPQTAFTNSTQSVNGLRFDSPNKYAIAGGGSVELKANTVGGSVNPTVEVLQGSHEIQVPVSILDDTAVTVAEGALLDVNSNLSLGGNTLTTAGAVNLNVGVTGGGTISNSGALGTAGTTPIAASLNSTGKLVVDLGANNTDFFDITGNATVSGLLDVLLEPGFAPSGSYTVLTASGSLDAAGLALDLSDAGMFSLAVSGKSLVLTASGALTGDYDDSGLVSQGDLDLVLLNWGDAVPPTPAGWINQIPTDGLVSQNELDGVLLNWGDSAGAGSIAAAVPEPTALVLAGLTAGVCLGIGRAPRRRSACGRVSPRLAKVLLERPFCTVVTHG